VTHSRKKIIACAAVIEEMLPVLPPDIAYEILDFGLHFRPENLQKILQEIIDKSAHDADTLILGYGLCSNGVVGLKAPDSVSLVIPKVHDCIAIFLGSHDEYVKQLKEETGTFFLAKGFIEVGDTPLEEYHRTVERHGKENADKVMKAMFGHYKRILFVNTGHDEVGKYRDHAKRTARQLELRYEEMKGSRVLIEQIIHGPWDEGFIIAKPGETITLMQFLEE
jgi:hypothetical protein